MNTSEFKWPNDVGKQLWGLGCPRHRFARERLICNPSKVVMQHLTYSQLAILGWDRPVAALEPPLKIVTIIRHPLPRALSLFKYHTRARDTGPSFSAGNNTFDSFYSYLAMLDARRKVSSPRADFNGLQQESQYHVLTQYSYLQGLPPTTYAFRYECLPETMAFIGHPEIRYPADDSRIARQPPSVLPADELKVYALY
eukprot:562313-Prymnesium_polylepis.1